MSLQTFTVAEPVWLKYLQFHFISHHGNEPICALNDVLVFGKSAAEDLEDQLSNEALLTEDEHPQQPGTLLDAMSAADRQPPQLDPLGKLDRLAAGPAEPDLSSDAAVHLKQSNAAVEVDAGEMGNKSSVSELLLSGKATSNATREQSADEQASGGHHPGQQCRHLQNPCMWEACIPASSHNADSWNVQSVFH